MKKFIGGGTLVIKVRNGRTGDRFVYREQSEKKDFHFGPELPTTRAPSVLGRYAGSPSSSWQPPVRVAIQLNNELTYPMIIREICFTNRLYQHQILVVLGGFHERRASTCTPGDNS